MATPSVLVLYINPLSPLATLFTPLTSLFSFPLTNPFYPLYPPPYHPPYHPSPPSLSPFLPPPLTTPFYPLYHPLITPYPPPHLPTLITPRHLLYHPLITLITPRPPCTLVPSSSTWPKSSCGALPIPSLHRKTPRGTSSQRKRSERKESKTVPIHDDQDDLGWSVVVGGKKSVGCV